MTPNEALRDGAAALDAAGVPGAGRDARLLLAYVLGLPTDRLTIDMPGHLNNRQQAEFGANIARRAAREPMSHILGKRSFFGRDFKVTRDVLDPRPETETLVHSALAKPFQSLLDLGTGSGCILLTLLAERPRAQGIGTDISAAALTVAVENARALDIPADRVDFILSDWFGKIGGQFDLIVSNPPYITADEMAELSPEVRTFEPRLALTPGGDGLGAYRRIADAALAHLAADGWLMVEIGPAQGEAVRALFERAGFVGVEILPDLDSRDRVVIGRNPD